MCIYTNSLHSEWPKPDRGCRVLTVRKTEWSKEPQDRVWGDHGSWNVRGKFQKGESHRQGFPKDYIKNSTQISGRTWAMCTQDRSQATHITEERFTCQPHRGGSVYRLSSVRLTAWWNETKTVNNLERKITESHVPTTSCSQCTGSTPSQQTYQEAGKCDWESRMRIDGSQETKE